MSHQIVSLGGLNPTNGFSCLNFCVEKCVSNHFLDFQSLGGFFFKHSEEKFSGVFVNDFEIGAIFIDLAFVVFLDDFFEFFARKKRFF